MLRGENIAMPIYVNLGRKLQKARESVGLTQSEVAGQLGIVREQLSYYENGRREIDLGTVSGLAAIYGYDLDYLLSDLDQEDSSVEPERSVSVSFRADGASEDDIRALTQANNFVLNLQWLNSLLSGGQR